MNTVQDSQENEVNGELNDLAVGNEVVISGDNPVGQRVDPSPAHDAKQLRIDNQDLTGRLNGSYSRIAELEAELIKHRSYVASKGQVADFRAFKPTFGKDQWKAVWESKYKHMYYNNVPAVNIEDKKFRRVMPILESVQDFLDNEDLYVVEDLNELLAYYANNSEAENFDDVRVKMNSILSVTTFITQLNLRNEEHKIVTRLDKLIAA